METEKLITVLCEINTLTEDILMEKREVCNSLGTKADVACGVEVCALLLIH